MSSPQRVRVFAPATVANVACAFDVLGFALDKPGDEVVAWKDSTPGVKVAAITGDDGRLPKDPIKNTAAVAVQGLLKHLGSSQGITLELHKHMPIGSGLGSSAASAVAGVFAAYHLLGKPIAIEELLPFVIEAERIACGSGHADNVAPALLGGFILIRSYNPIDIIRIDSPESLYCAVVYPDVEVRTEDARKVLKHKVELRKVVTQMGNIAGLIAGLQQHDLPLIGRSLEDVLIEPERSILIPGFAKVKEAALQNKALGCSISGSGPSIFALCASKEIAEACGDAMSKQFELLSIKSNVYVSKVNRRGPELIEAQ